MAGVVSFVRGESEVEASDLQEDSKILMSPGTKEVNKDDDSLPKVLGGDHKYRSVVTTDMTHLQFACKESCREMSAPTVQSWRRIKRIGRYLLGREKLVEHEPEVARVELVRS